MVVGSYVGDGTNNRFIDLGKTPQAVLVIERRGPTYSYHGLVADGLPDSNAWHTEGGFLVGGFLNLAAGSSDGTTRNPYRYLAFYWEA